MNSLKVFSGDCQLIDAGIATNLVDLNNRQLFTGDIVEIIPGRHIDNEWVSDAAIGNWENDEDYPPEESMVTGNQYQSYAGGLVVTLTQTPKTFVMGLIDNTCDGSSDWRLLFVKSYKDVELNKKHDFFRMSIREVK